MYDSREPCIALAATTLRVLGLRVQDWTLPLPCACQVMRSTIVASALPKYRAYLQPSSQHEEGEDGESEAPRSASASQPRRASAAVCADADSEHAVPRHGEKG